mmetsp:Transcript_74200/g.179475  ORF Transcript_74200/g.179475 Transcript_74200/m.179475 type:complete len:218 (+) Transcript_74200:74-727(+)
MQTMRSLILDAHALAGVVPGIPDVGNGISGLGDEDLVLNDRAAEATAHGGTEEGGDGAVTATAAELGVDLDELALASAAEGAAVVAAAGLVGDPVKHGIVEVDDRDIILGAEEAAALAAAVALLGSHHRGVPLDGVLTDVDVLGGLHLLDNVLRVLHAGAGSASGAHGGSIAARAAPIGLDSMGDDLGDSDGRGRYPGHHEAVLDDERRRGGRHVWL